MHSRTSSCAACRFELEPDNPRALELAEEDLEVLIADLDELPRFQILGNTQGMYETNRFQALVLEEINEYRRAGLPSPHRPDTMPKELLEACKRLLGNRKAPLTAAQVKKLVLRFGGRNAGKLQLVCLIALGFTAFLCWDDLKDLRHHNLHMTSDHMSITLGKRKTGQLREGSVILVAHTGSLPCPVPLTERFLLVGQHKQSDYLPDSAAVFPLYRPLARYCLEFSEVYLLQFFFACY